MGHAHRPATPADTAQLQQVQEAIRPPEISKRYREGPPPCLNSPESLKLSARLDYFQSKSAELYSISIYYVVLFEGFRYQTTLAQTFRKIFTAPTLAWEELKGFFSDEKQVVLVLSEIEKARRIIAQHANNFILQISDFVQIELLKKEQAYQFLRKLVNFSAEKREHHPLKYDTHVDFFMADSALECYSGYLQADDFYVKVLTLKEPTIQSWPLILKQLYEIAGSFHVVTEWRCRHSADSRKKIQSARRHFHNSKTSLMSQIKADGSPHMADVLVDDSKESLVHSLGACLTELELKGNYFGEFSLSIVVYDRDRAAVERRKC